MENYFIYIDILLSGLGEPDVKGKKGKKKNNSKKTLPLQTFLHNKVVCRGVYIYLKNHPPPMLLLTCLLTSGITNEFLGNLFF